MARKSPTCKKCGNSLKGHMGKEKDICPSQHGFQRTTDGKFKCCNTGCDKTFVSAHIAKNHSNSTSCKCFAGEETPVPCPNSCGEVFRGSSGRANAATHAASTMCRNHPDRTEEHRTTVSHVIANDTKHCSGCKTSKSILEFGNSPSAKNATGLDYFCYKCRAIYAMRSNCIHRAKKEGHGSAGLTMDYIKSLVVPRCPVFGLDLQYGSKEVSRNSATLDAIDHAKGHVPGNLKIISWFANTIKNNSNIGEMTKLIDVLEKKLEGSELPVGTATLSSDSKKCKLCKLPKPKSDFKTPTTVNCNKCKSVCSSFKNLKTRAKKTGSICTLARQELIDLSKTQYVCPILGVPLRFGGTGKICDQSASIDRIDPKGGYVLSNIWYISYKANRMKSDATLEEIKKVLDYMKSGGGCA